MAQWQTRPVFVSSTFRDMQAERDILRDHVIPELEERLHERRAHIEAVDLRWGVETTSAAEEEQRELLVLKVCLDEIERCRPFLVAILGDRYGWVPDPARMRYAVEEAGFETTIEGKSVTALEIEFGVLDSSDQRARSHFYFRAPLPYDKMPPDVAAQYSDAHSLHEDVRAGVPRLKALKARIEDEMGERVHTYSAEWDEGSQEVVGLEEFGEMVLEHLWADLAAGIPPLEEQEEVTWRDEERAAAEQFVELSARDFVGREQITADLLEFARTDGGDWATCITGEAGSGKSALLAHLCRRLEEAPDDLLLLSHFVGVTPRSTSVDGLLLRWIEELAEFLGERTPVQEGASANDLEEAFASLLGRAALQTRVVVVLDTLNQLEASTRGQHLTWLPRLWPDNARLVASAVPCSASDALLEREGARVLPLPPVPPPEAQQIALRICRRYHRTPPQAALDALVAKTGDDGAPAAGNPLWLTLAVEELNLLDQDDFRRSERRWPDLRGDEQLLRLLLAVIDEMPGDVAGLYQWMLAKTEEVWGEAWAGGFANLLALSRAGWRETDLQALLPDVSGEEWDPARFAGVRRSFRGHLVRRGAHEQWDFAHAQTRPAIERRNLTDPGEVRRLHALIADYLEDLPLDDPLHDSETMFHLIGADDPARAAGYYGRDLTEGERGGATQRLAEPIIAGEGEENPGLQWALSMLEAEGVEDEVTGGVAQSFIFDLRDAIENDTRLATDLALLEPTRVVFERLAAADPGNAQWQHDLSVSHGKLGDVLVAQGDLPGALEQYEAGLAIAERLAAADPGNAQWQRVLSVSHNKLGDVLRAQGELPGALEQYEADLAIAARLAASDPGNAQWQRALSVSHNKLGDVLVAQGDLSAALEAYEHLPEIAGRLAAADPGNAGWQHDLVASHQRIGDVVAAHGDLPGALEHYETGLEIAERLAAADPGNAGWQRDLSVSHKKLGDVLRAQGDLPGALEHYEADLAIAERLAAADPGNAQWQRGLSVSHERHGDLLQAHGDLPGALEHYEVRHEIAERLAAADPGNAGWQRDLSVSHIKLGDVLVAQGKLPGALEQYEAGLAIISRLAAADPGNAGWQRDLSVSHDTLGDVMMAQGDLSGALEQYEASLVIAERLAEEDPGNAGWQHDLMASHQRMGDVAAAQGNLSMAVEAYEHLLEVAERLAAADPGNAVWQRDLSVSHYRLGHVANEADRQEEAIRHLLRCREVLRGMRERGMHLDPQAAQVLQHLEGLAL